MELLLKTDLEIGQTLYYADWNSKTIYAPCVICNNKREIEVTINDETFNIHCPKCTGKATKGDTSRKIIIKEYSVGENCISEMLTNNGETFCVKIGYSKLDIKTLIDANGRVQYYTDKSECIEVVKNLNKVKKAKIKAFMEEVKHDRS